MASETIRIINGGSNDDDYTCYWSETIQNINNIINNSDKIPRNAKITRVGVYCSADYDGGLGTNPYKAYLQFGFGTSTAINIHLLGETRITKNPTLYPSNRGLDITSYLSSRFYPWGINAGGQERFLAIVYTSSALITRQKMEYADLVIDYEIPTYTVTFKNWDGSVLKVEKVSYNGVPTPPDNPSRPADCQYVYSFSKWDKTITNITSDTTYTAVYYKSLREYPVVVYYGEAHDKIEARYEYGEVIYLERYVRPHEHFVHWKANRTNYTFTENSITLNETIIGENYEDSILNGVWIYQISEPNKYPVNMAVSPSGAGRVQLTDYAGNLIGEASDETGVQYQVVFDTYKFIAVPNEGYRFVEWYDSTDPNTLFTNPNNSIMVTGETTVIAYFELDKINNIYINEVNPKSVYFDQSNIVFVVDGTIPSLSGSIWDTVDGFNFKVQNTVPSGMTEAKEVYVDLKKYYG